MKGSILSFNSVFVDWEHNLYLVTSLFVFLMIYLFLESFWGCQLSGAQLTGARFSGAQFA